MSTESGVQADSALPDGSVRLCAVPAVDPALRASHLRTLPKAQEWYLEQRLRHGAAYHFVRGTQPVGFAVVDGEDLVAFHVLPGSASAQECWTLAIWATGARCVLALSFDTALLALAQPQALQTEVIGWLFREVSGGARVPPAPSWKVALAQGTELPEIAALEPGFFADAQELAWYLQTGGLWSVRGPSGLVACGLTAQIHPTLPATDVGMVVGRPWRGQGIGSALVRWLQDRVLAQGRVPVAGCGVDNPASRRALERAGFLLTDTMLRLTVSHN